MKTHEEKTIQYGGGGEKQKKNHGAGSSNENNSLEEGEDTTSSVDESDSDDLVPIHEDKSAFNGVLFERTYKRIGHNYIIICLNEYRKQYFKELIKNFLERFKAVNSILFLNVIWKNGIMKGSLLSHLPTSTVKHKDYLAWSSITI